MIKSLIESRCLLVKKFLIFIFSLFFLSQSVSAASLCSYENQTKNNQKAANIKALYEVVEVTEKFDDMDVTSKTIEISILNIPKELYVVIKNNVTKEEKVFTNADAVDGIVKFKWNEIDYVTTFTIQIFTTNKTNCPDERIKTIYLTTPRYNEFSKKYICSELSEFYLCQEFVTSKEFDENYFLKQLDSFRNEKIDEKGNEILENNLTITDKIFEFMNTYKWYILGGLTILATILIVISVKKNKKQRDLSL